MAWQSVYVSCCRSLHGMLLPMLAGVTSQVWDVTSTFVSCWCDRHIGMIVSLLLYSKIEGNWDVGTLLFREYLTLPVYKYGFTALKIICFTAWVQIVSTSSYMWLIQTTSQNNISCWTYRWRILKILCFWVTPCTSAAVYEYDGQQMTSEAITVRPFILPFNLGPLSQRSLL